MRIRVPVIKAGEGSWVLMSHLILSIQKLLDLQDMVLHELAMQEALLKVPGLDIGSVGISLSDTSEQLQKLVQGLLVQQQERDLVSLTRLGEV